MSGFRVSAAFACLTSAVMVLATGAAPALAGTSASSGSAGQVVMQGLVTDSAGQPVAGAQVQLYALPSQSFLDTQVVQPGQRVPISLVGQAVSTSSGQYDLQIASQAAVQSSAGPGGIVNFTAVVVGERAGAGSFSFSRRLSVTSGQPVLASVEGSGTSAAAPAVADLQTAAPGAVPDVTCHLGYIFIKDGGKDWGSIGSSYLRYPGVNADFSYQSGQTTTLGVGVSATPGGGFSVGGTFTWTATQSLTANFYTNIGPSSHAYQSQWVPGEYENFWSPPECGSTYWTSSPHHWVASAGSVSNINIPYTPVKYCAVETAAKSITIEKSTSDTFTANLGWTQPEFGGFNATAQTGWSTTNKLIYTNTNHQSWHLCGLGDYLGGSPGRVVAGLPG